MLQGHEIGHVDEMPRQVLGLCMVCAQNTSAMGQNLAEQGLTNGTQVDQINRAACGLRQRLGQVKALYGGHGLAGIDEIAKIPGFEDAGFDTAQAVLGVAWRPTEDLTLVADLTWINWSAYQNPTARIGALSVVERGARIVRVHDVKDTVDALKVWQAVQANA